MGCDKGGKSSIFQKQRFMQMKSNISRQFVNDLYKLSQENHPDSIEHQAMRCLLDYIGVTIAGLNDISDKIIKVFDFLGCPEGDAQVIGLQVKTSKETAALLNGMSSHVLELDDGIRYGMIHLASPIISSLMAFASHDQITGKSFLNGIIVGYEAAIRLSYAMQPGHYSRGYHPTSTCGAIGAAAGISAMLGFNESQMYDAISAASISSGGSLKAIEGGSLLKPFNSGKAASLGVYCAAVAHAGFSAPDDVLSGSSGFLYMMSDSLDELILTGSSGTSYWISSIYFKPFAACRHAHPAIEAVLRIKKKNCFLPSEIKRIDIETYASVIGKHDHHIVKDVSSAKMSIPFSVALAAVVGSATNAAYNDNTLADDEILRVSRNVHIAGSSELSSLVPDKRSAIVNVLLCSGVRHEGRVDYPLGEPENPLNDTQLEDKFYSLTDYAGLERRLAKKVAFAVWDLNNRFEDFLEAIGTINIYDKE